MARPLIMLLNNFCKINDVNLYLNNIYPLYKDIYLNEYLNINALNLKKDLSNHEILDIKKYLIDNCLIENDIKKKYNEFVKGKELDELCLTEKLICLQYTLDYFEVSKEQLNILIDSI